MFHLALAKDTDPYNAGSDGESRHQVPRLQSLCPLLPLRQLHLLDEVHLLPAQTLFIGVYPGREGRAGGLLRRLVSHV